MINDDIKIFFSKPENVLLFRGEGPSNRGGLHFTPDENWAKQFSQVAIIKGYLPANSKIKLISETDFETGFKLGISSEYALWDFFFAQGYDAIVGHDAMNSRIMDVVIHPKHLHNFKP